MTSNGEALGKVSRKNLGTLGRCSGDMSSWKFPNTSRNGRLFLAFPCA